MSSSLVWFRSCRRHHLVVFHLIDVVMRRRWLLVVLNQRGWWVLIKTRWQQYVAQRTLIVRFTPFVYRFNKFRFGWVLHLWGLEPTLGLVLRYSSRDWLFRQISPLIIPLSNLCCGDRRLETNADLIRSELDVIIVPLKDLLLFFLILEVYVDSLAPIEQLLIIVSLRVVQSW